jgi:hypothetical protein
VNGSAAKASRREIRRALGEPVTEAVLRHDDAIGALVASHGLTARAASVTQRDVDALGLSLTTHLTGLSRWQRLKWLLKL